MAYSTIPKPSLYFNTKLYTGNGSTNAITGVGFQPDWVWIKNRSNSSSHNVFDAVRGVTKAIFTNATDAEATEASRLSAFGTDGFTINGDTSNQTNASGSNFASWNWKASGTNISNSSGSNGATLASAGIKNDTAGISIVTYTGDGNARTVYHGLSSCAMVIHKCLNSSEDWGVQHKDIGAAYQLQLDTNIAKVDKSGNGSMALPAANVFSVNNSGQWGSNSNNYVAYCFAEKTGFSKFGSYTGNGNADGTFIYTGFKPAWIMLKNTSNAQNWYMYDNKRSNFNLSNDHIYADLSNAETADSSHGIDILSNGFKIRTSNDGWNGSGENYIYMTFAEEPLVANVGASIPATAR